MPDRCQSIRNEYNQLLNELAQYTSMLEDFRYPANAKGQIFGQIPHLRNLINMKRQQLIDCQNQLSPVYGVKIYGYEFNQGLPNYELIAGKDTLVRVFIGSIDTLYVARVDYAFIHVRGPRGIDFTLEAEIPNPMFENLVQLYGENNNLNFYLRGEQIPVVGNYVFTAYFFASGRPIGSLDLGRANFRMTRDLRLLIRPVFSRPQDSRRGLSDAGYYALINALQVVSRTYPIRKGVGMMDADRSLGLRFTFINDPIPDPYPIYEGARIALNEFNSNKSGPDQADRILVIRDELVPDEPKGGVSDGFKSAAVIYHPRWNDLGHFICHELGHSLGIEDHSPDPSIHDPSAFDVLNRRTIWNPLTTMYATVGTNTDNLVMFEPQQWNKVWFNLLSLNSTGPAFDPVLDPHGGGNSV